MGEVERRCKSEKKVLAAAHSIQKKFVALFNEGREESDHIYPTPT